MWTLVIALIAGLIYGYMTPESQDKGRLLWKGLLYGVVLAIIVGLLAFVFGLNPLGLADMGFLGIVVAVLALTIAFVIGTWIGDAVSERRGGRGTRTRRV